jgi:hypothetical protein
MSDVNIRAALLTSAGRARVESSHYAPLPLVRTRFSSQARSVPSSGGLNGFV